MGGKDYAAGSLLAIELDAEYVGAVFAESARRVTAEQARSLFEGVSDTRRVDGWAKVRAAPMLAAHTRATTSRRMLNSR